MPGQTASPVRNSSAPVAAVPASVTARVLPVLVVLAGWAFSGWMYRLLDRAAEERAEEFFRERVAEAQAAIAVRMGHYVDALHGGTSFFAAARTVDRDAWRVFAESLQLRRRFPGINGLGVILAVPPDQVDAWKARVRVPGEPEPEIKPFPGTTDLPAGEPRYLISYVEGNVGERAPIGRNVATEPSRRRAADLARDTGEPQIHQRIPGSRDTQRRSGLLLYAPLYEKNAPTNTVAERRAAHLGWVYAQVFPDVFLDGVLGPLGDRLRLHFFEEGGIAPERLLYASDPGDGGALPEFERVTELTLAGQRFELGWRRGPKFPRPDPLPAWWVGGSLALASLLLGGLLANLQSFGRGANAIAAARAAELAASEERFREAFDLAGIGMALVALDGHLQRVNQAFCEIVGYPEARLLQKRFQDLTHPEDLAAGLALQRELVEGRRRSYQLEMRCMHREGHSVWIRLTAALVRDAAGGPLHAIAQAEDITERKRLEANLAHARDEALEAARLKSEFLATMIDEIRPPLQEAFGATRLLRRTPLAPEHVAPVRALELAGESLLAISHDILDYSRLESGQLRLEPAVFDLRACLDEALATFAERARQKRIRLEATVATRVPTHAMADAKRLREILVHLLGHALRFTRAGEVRVNLTAEALDAAGRQRLKFAVRDTGDGVAPEQMDRLFKPADGPAPPAAQLAGGGLGLAISKRLAELMGGTMWAQSEPGRGSTFHFTILVEPREASQATPAGAG